MNEFEIMQQLNESIEFLLSEEESEVVEEEFEMDYIELEEGVKESLEALKKWFKEKKEDIKNKFRDIKAQVLKKMGKELPPEKQKELKEEMKGVQEDCNNIVRDCDKGMAAKVLDTAYELKDDIVSNMAKMQKRIAKIAAILSITAGVATMASAVYRADVATDGGVKRGMADKKAKFDEKRAQKKNTVKAKFRVVEEEVELEEDYDLEFTLEEELILTEGVKEALKAIGDWFREKKAMVKERISKVGNKEAKEAFNEALGACNEGLNAVGARDVEKAKGCKEKAMKALKIAAGILAGGAAVAGGAVAAKKHMDKKKNGNLPAVVEEVELALEEAFDNFIYELDLEEDYDLEFTLEEELILAEGVKEALRAIGDWFREKKAMVKERISKIGNKEAKEAFGDALNACNEGLNAVGARDVEKAKGCKEKAMKALKIAAGILAGGAAVAGGAVAAKKHMDKKKNGNLPAVVEEVEIEDLELED